MLTIERLNAHYGASHILHGVDLDLTAGTIAAVLGRNGVGKTTTVRGVMRLVPPTSGRVRPDLDSRTGFRHREWQKCWRLIKPGQKCGAKL